MYFPAAQDWRSIWRNLALWALLAGRHTTQTCIQWILSTPPPPPIHPTVCFPVVPTVKTDKDHRTYQGPLLGAAIIFFPTYRAECKLAGRAAWLETTPQTHFLNSSPGESDCWDCWEKGAENGGAQVVQLLQPDLPKLVLHLRLNESQESCRCPQQQQRHVNIWTTLQQCVNNTHSRKRMKRCHQIPRFNRRDKTKKQEMW